MSELDNRAHEPPDDLNRGRAARAFRWFGLIAALGLLAIAAYNLKL
ncbi:MAG: hypothetical protein ABWY78_01720 [Microvirga sp.]